MVVPKLPQGVAPRLRAVLDDIYKRANIRGLPSWPARGAVAFTWDDGRMDHYTAATLHAERGQRATFCLTKDLIASGPDFLTQSQVQEIADMGHELAAHSVTHTSFTTGGLTAAQRAAEYDESKAYLEDTYGVRCETWAWPYGDRNATVDQEAYLRFQRFFGAGERNSLAVYDPLHASPFIMRLNLDGTTAVHNRAKAMIRQAVVSRNVPLFVAHRLDVASAPTTAQYTELLDLCVDLDIPVLTVSEIFPGAALLADPGFEDPDLTDWWVVKNGGGAGTAASVVDTPVEGLSGTRSLKLTASSPDWVYVTQPMIVQPGVEYTMSGRYRNSSAAVTADQSFRVRYFDAFSNAAGNNSSTLTASTTWARKSWTFTPAQNIRQVFVDVLLLPSTANHELWVDHLHIAPTAQGSFG